MTEHLGRMGDVGVFLLGCSKLCARSLGRVPEALAFNDGSPENPPSPPSLRTGQINRVPSHRKLKSRYSAEDLHSHALSMHDHVPAFPLLVSPFFRVRRRRGRWRRLAVVTCERAGCENFPRVRVPPISCQHQHPEAVLLSPFQPVRSVCSTRVQLGPTRIDIPL